MGIEVRKKTTPIETIIVMQTLFSEAPFFYFIW